jgi:hypothetical protein
MAIAGKIGFCPCGSGKPIYQCCLKGKTIASAEELQAEVQRIADQRNKRKIDDFRGLSAEQMHRLLYSPFDSPDLVRLTDHLPDLDPLPPVLQLLFPLAAAIGEKGIKPTATGNLPRKLVREIALEYWGEEYYRERTEFGDLMGEADFRDLQTIRVVAELAGILRKYRGKLILGGKWKKPLASGDSSPLYLGMLHAFIEKFNWAYSWGWSEIPFIQQAFLYSLYLLAIDGAKFRPAEHYAAAFLRAFPVLLEEVEETPLFSREERLGATYIQQTFWGLLRLFGLVEIKDSDGFLRRMGAVRRTPLLAELVSFNV